MEATTLYEQLGGAPAVDAAVDVFYRKVLSDDRVSHFFDDVDMDRQIAKQKSFLTMVFGGPVAYTGKDMRAAHAGRQITDADFDALVEDLVAALDHFNVPPREKNDLLGLLAPMRKDIVGA